MPLNDDASSDGGDTVDDAAALIAEDADLIDSDLMQLITQPGFSTADAVSQIPEVVDRLVRREAVILDAAKAPDFDIGKLKAAMQGAKEIH